MPKSSPAKKKRPTKNKSRKTASIAIPKVQEQSPVPSENQATSSGRPKLLKRLNYSVWQKNRQDSITQRKPLPSVWEISRRAGEMLWRRKGLIIGIVAIYGLLDLLLAQGLTSTSEIANLKHALNSGFHGKSSSFVSSLGIFVLFAGSSSNTSGSNPAAYQFILGLMVSLAIIWSLRQTIGGISVRIRDAYYRGMYPFVPFILVLLVIGIQLLPLLIGSSLYYLVTSTGIAVGGIETVIWAVLFVGLAALSLFLISSSLFALYIVTLPDMTPMKALRSARELTRYRHWTMLRKILFLPLVLVVLLGVIMLPVVLVATALTQWVFFVLSIFILAIIHGYMYTLYRELIRE